jgi:hypothetical protein
VKRGVGDFSADLLITPDNMDVKVQYGNWTGWIVNGSSSD